MKYGVGGVSMNIYLVYEHDSFDDYAVILVTKNENKAISLTGEETRRLE